MVLRARSRVGRPVRRAAPPARTAAGPRLRRRMRCRLDAEREGVRLTGLCRAADLFARRRRWRSICSSTAARCGTSCCSGRCGRPMPMCCRPRPAPGGGAVPRLRPGAGRRERPPRQGRGALPRSGAGPRPGRLGLRQALAGAGHRASTTVAAATLGAMRPELAARGSTRWTGRPARLSRGYGVPGAAVAGLCRGRRAGSSVPRHSRTTAGAAPPARRRPGAGARELHRRPDRGRDRHRRPARRARTAGLRAAEGARRPNAAWPAQVLLIPEIVELGRATPRVLLELRRRPAPARAGGRALRRRRGRRARDAGAARRRWTPRRCSRDILDALADRGRQGQLASAGPDRRGAVAHGLPRLGPVRARGCGPTR